MTKIILQPKTKNIEDLIKDCAEGRLPFSGPNSLYSKFHEMGYSTTSLYEMVRAQKKGKA